MTKNPLFILGMILLGVIGMLTFITLTANSPNDQKNGFTRRGLNGTKALFLDELKTGEPVYKFCGATAHRFFFTGRDLRRICSATMDLKSLPPVIIPFPLTAQVLTAYDQKVDSPYVYLYANNLASILSARLDDTAVRRTTVSPTLYTTLLQLPGGSMVLRAFDSSGIWQVFKKREPRTGAILQQAPVIEPRENAGFGSDGMLRYDTTTHRLMYVQFYQNRFFCTDTNLTLLYSGQTIDTTNYKRVFTRNFTTGKNEGTLLPSVPLHIINRACCVDGGYMYIMSTLKADNEGNAGFRDNSVVDVYDIRNGRYKRSFYIPDLNGEKAENFFIAGHRMLVAYTRSIGAYTIPDR